MGETCGGQLGNNADGFFDVKVLSKKHLNEYCAATSQRQMLRDATQRRRGGVFRIPKTFVTKKMALKTP